jgi:O-antigen/teichoic acid export membrane protein
MGRRKSAILGTISSQIYTVVIIIVSIATTPLVVRKLNADIYGLSLIISQIATYVGIFDFGLGAGVSRFLAGTKEETDENKDLINRIVFTSFVVYTLLALAIIVISLIGFSSPLANGLFSSSPETDAYKILLIMLVLVCLQLILKALSGIFFAHQRQFLANTILFIMSLANFVSVVAFVSMGYSLWSFVYAQAIALGINVILNVYYFRKYYSYVKFDSKYYDYRLIKEVFSYGIAMFVITLATQLIFHTDRILVGSLVSLVAVSVYSITTRIPELVTMLLWRITDNAFPGIVESIKTDKASFLRIHNELMNVTMALSTVCFWVILLFSYPFIKLWVGEEFYAGTLILILMTYLYLIQHTFIHVTSMCLSAAGVVKQISRIYITEAILNIILSVILVKQFGMLGVVYGTILAGLLTSVWFTPGVAIKYMGSNFGAYILSVVKPIAINSVLGIVAYVAFVNFFATINNLLTLVVASGATCLILLLPFAYKNRNLIRTLMASFTKV